MSTKSNYSGFASIREFMVVSQDKPTITHDRNDVIVTAKNYGYKKTRVIAVDSNNIDWSQY